MDIEIKIDGIKELERNLNKVYEGMIKGANKGMKEVSENIQSVAKSIAPSDGRNLLKNAIMTMESSGRPFNVYNVYIDVVVCPFATYVYFGTGIYSGSGKYYWWVGESQLENSSVDIISKYKYKGNGSPDKYIYSSRGERMWRIRGQKPKRIFEGGYGEISENESAIYVTKEQNRDIISRAIRNEIRKGM